MGGSSDPSVPRSPGVSPQKLQGGPWAPPPCRVKSSENCQVFACGSLSGTLGIFVGFSVRCSSLGKVYCLVLCPLRPDPCMPRCWLSPLSFFCVRYARRRRFLSFSLSQVLGKPKPLSGFGIPLVSLRRGHALRARSVRPARLLPLGSAPAPVFFFFFLRRRRRSLVWLWLVAVCSVSLCVGVFFWVGFSLLCFACTCK